MYARFGFLGAFVLAALLAACGGGGGGGSSCCPVTASPSATPTSTAAPTQNVTLGGSVQNVTLPVPAGASYSGTISVPAGSGTISFAAATSPPGNVPVLDVAHLRKATAAKRIADTGAPYTTAAYITLTPTTATTLNGNLTFTVSPASTYYVAQYSPQGYWITLGTISGAYVATFQTSYLAANVAEYFAVYSGGTLPSPNPDGCVGVQPDLTTRGSAQTQAVGVQPTAGAYPYTGTYTETISRATPCAIPTAVSSASVAINVTMSPGPAGEVYENSTETDAYSTETVTTNTSALVKQITTPVTPSFEELNETTTDEVGDSVTTTYGTPLLFAVGSLPYTTPITNVPPTTVNTTLADGSTMDRNYSGTSGNYTETDTIPGLSVQSTITNSGGSGTYTVQTPNFASGGVTDIVFTYQAPTGGSNSTITLTENAGGTTTPLTIPAWFTAGNYYTDTLTGSAATSAPLPAPCASAYTGTTGSFYPFTRTTTVVDAVLGYSDTRTVTSYVAGNFNSSGVVGPVCVSISDVEQIYYDYFLDTPYSLYVSETGAPLQTDTITEAYWFTSGNPPTGYSRVRIDGANAIPGLAASIATHETAIDFRRSLQHAQRIENFARNVGTHIGGVK